MKLKELLKGIENFKIKGDSELEDLDVDSLRPIDALMLLNKWKKEADN